jgi:hypothetical protein
LLETAYGYGPNHRPIDDDGHASTPAHEARIAVAGHVEAGLGIARRDAQLPRRLALSSRGPGLVRRDRRRGQRGAVEAQQTDQLAVVVADGYDRDLAAPSQLGLDGRDRGLGST